MLNINHSSRITSIALLILLTILSLVRTSRLLLLYLLMHFIGAAYSQSPNTWIQRADFEGGNRSRAVGFSIGSKGYLGTGFNGGFLNDFWEYDPALDSWTQKADFGGSARYNAVGFSIKDKGYIGTGLDEFDFQKDFWQYDPLNNTWIEKKEFGGSARMEAVAFSIGSKGYCGTGDDNKNGYLKDFWEYDPDLDTWTQKQDIIHPRTGAVGFSIGNKGYLGTGYNLNGFKENFWEYDPLLNTWSQKADFAGGLRSNAVGFTIGGYGYIGTGYVSANGFVDFNDLWAYNPASNNWIQKADFGGTGRSNAVGFSIEGMGYITTGIVGDPFLNDSRQDCWEYTPSPFGVGAPSIINTHAMFSLFPNPATNQFMVDLQLNSEVNAEAIIEVINLVGQVVFHKTFSMLKGKLEETIKLTDATDGSYLVRVMVNDQVYGGRIVFERE